MNTLDTLSRVNELLKLMQDTPQDHAAQIDLAKSLAQDLTAQLRR